MNTEVLLDGFSEYQKARNMAKSTIEWERFVLSLFLNFLEAENILLLTDVDPKVMIRYQLHLAGLKNRKGNPYNVNTQNMAIGVVRTFYRFLRRKGEVFIDPTDGFEFAKGSRSLPRTILTLKEMKLVLKQPNENIVWGKRDKAILEVLYSTGIRQGELRHLDLNDLNQDDRTIFIRDGKGSKDRVVPCGDMAWKCLNAYLNVRNDLILERDEQAVFVNMAGKRINKARMVKIIKKYARLAGLKRTNITPHSFRHSCATHMCDAGCDIRYIQELLGHASPATTAIYISVSIRKLKDAHTKYHQEKNLLRK